MSKYPTLVREQPRRLLMYCVKNCEIAMGFRHAARKFTKVRTIEGECSMEIESFRRWKDCNRCNLKVEGCAFSWLELCLGVRVLLE